ncbi:cold-inducible protein YdjO-related protein [Thermotalea metallivorans]|uniref:Cold-shock protein n=1 Tax=Thermotalea metallivorans TaxID=520762 RepID=A0A140L6C4_9FIRM|nr:cold-inducible protein YdjO-related protein [Thermotalea metallivorans]KXG76099.1 hypothetical protein AN619_10560 [Thermotalea metallivorans]
MFFQQQEEEKKPIYAKKEVDIWQCPQCVGWMQKEFTVSLHPICPFCSSHMIEGVREVKVLM